MSSPESISPDVFNAAVLRIRILEAEKDGILNHVKKVHGKGGPP